MIACRWRAWLDEGRSEDLEPELAAVWPALVAKARRILGNAAAAEDAVQDAMVELLRNRDTCTGEVPLSAIVHRLTTECALMQARRESRRFRRERSWGACEPATREAAEPEVPDLTRLSARQRQVVLAFADGSDSRTIAARLGTTPGNVQVLLHRARRAMKRVQSHAV